MESTIDVAEAARQLKVHPSRIRVLISTGRLPARKLAGVWLIERDDLIPLRKRNRKGGRPPKHPSGNNSKTKRFMGKQ